MEESCKIDDTNRFKISATAAPKSPLTHKRWRAGRHGVHKCRGKRRLRLLTSAPRELASWRGGTVKSLVTSSHLPSGPVRPRLYVQGAKWRGSKSTFLG